jgi:hypothetical protein
MVHTLATDVRLASPDRIDALMVETKFSRRAILGRIFIDWSRDGYAVDIQTDDLSYWSSILYIYFKSSMIDS